MGGISAQRVEKIEPSSRIRSCHSSRRVHAHMATVASEPNKPLDRISFFIRPMLSPSTLSRSPRTNSGSLYSQPTLNTVPQIKDNCVQSSIYLSVWLFTG